MNPHAGTTTVGTNADTLTRGMHIGRTEVANQALMKDKNGASVVFPATSGCAVGSIQITLYPDGMKNPLPDNTESLLFEVDAEWLKATLESGVPDLTIEVAEEALFCCLPLI